MRSLALEQIILLLLFVGVPLLNLLVGWLKRRARAQQRPFPPELSATDPHEEPRVIAVPVRALEPILSRADPRREPPAFSPPRGVRRARPLGGRAEVRRAIVAMTILGPCRGLEASPPTTPVRTALR